jgi:hypothetical protein
MFASSCQSHLGSRLLSRAKNKWPKCMWPLRLHQGWRAKTRLRPGIAHGRGPLLHRRDSWTLHRCSPCSRHRPPLLNASVTSNLMGSRPHNKHHLATNHPDLAYSYTTFYRDPCNTPTSTTRTALTRPINTIPPACRGDAAVRSWNGANLRPRHSSSCLPRRCVYLSCSQYTCGTRPCTSQLAYTMLTVES